MYGQGNSEYCVDIVMCIDATGSMASIINEVKENAMSLYNEFVDGMEMNGKYVDTLRVKIIAFRDFICDSQPMVQSDFFVLPKDSTKLRSFLDGIEAIGGGDGPECALEAVSVAMNSDWTLEGEKRRHIIVVFSDAPTMTIGERAGCPNYPDDIPSGIQEFCAWWEGTGQTYYGTMQSTAGRLIAFVPNDESWNRFTSLNRFVPVYTAARGCKDVDMRTIIDTVVCSF
ncbi:MAG: VWA domain-containing protein [Clostridia bacterium]|nr:VWA domain-containing protein [Clostridia bacterium]